MTALLGLALCLCAAWLLAGRFAPSNGDLDRPLAASVLFPAIGIVSVRLWAGVGFARHPAILLLALAGAALTAALRPGRTPSFKKRDPPEPADPPAALGGHLISVALGAAAVGLAIFAAVLLPIWHWDSLGYHLPFVNYALQGGSLSAVPWDQPYLGTYPHAVELWDLGARSLLPDDRLIDIAQLPLVGVGALAVAGLTRRLGGSRGAAAAAGALWLTLPAVFLQLPSNYVDASAASFLLLAAYWVVAPPTASSVLLAGTALGLFLGAKPSAPPAVALLLAILAVRSFRRGLWPAAVAASLVVVGLGAESYLSTWLRYGNPIWPIEVRFGPIHLPGRGSLAEVLGAGSAAPHLSGPLASRIWRSWGSLHPLPAYDMRIGGFGPLFLLALPLAVVSVVRHGRPLCLLLLVAALLTPDPALARYTLAFPGLCLALAFAELGKLPPRLAAGLSLLAPLLAGAALVWTLPGLTGNVVSLLGIVRMSPLEREAALLPVSTPSDWAAFRAHLDATDSIAVDRSLDVTYLLWRPDLRNRVIRLPDDTPAPELLTLVAGCSYLVAGETGPAGDLVTRLPERFGPLFACGASEPSCRVYRVKNAISPRADSP